MSLLSNIRAEVAASIAVKQALLEDETLLTQAEALARQCVEALRAGSKIIFAGNGGSFADAQHLSAEFVSRFKFDRAPLASLTLGTNNSALSAIGNDYGYDQVFHVSWKLSPRKATCSSASVPAATARIFLLP